MHSLTYQLVLQFSSSVVALDELIALEDALSESLGASATVDGHDFGSGEGNIFILTGDPTATLRLLLPVLAELGHENGATVAYRSVGSDQFTVIWPAEYRRAFSLA
jgi:hypothetical protein